MTVGTAREAYDDLAPDYDLLTAEYPYERWLAALEALARAHGLDGRDVLDVACGTGKSFLPLLRRGWRVVGCDISPAMLALAAAKAPTAELVQADMRALPALGEFDLVTCLDDALNYLLEEDELEAALAGIRDNLRPRGIAIWDLNALAQYRAAFARDRTTDRDGVFLAWRGETTPSLEPGGPAQATVEVFAPAAGGLWERRSSVHRQRHWPQPVVRAVAARAGLEVLAVHGQHEGAVLEPVFDELVHTKAVYLAAGSERG
ncbi:MAG TPA: class I SAM-dependent methyltransferase [Solirubrobacteraceae bacterium]|nr:class I SAM-dependent methyltransferase [Solirubrobacteraceae bacterium]